ncbi:MAG: sulfatase-like hydrolase/transferase [Vicinamibacteria bacterium]
MRPRALIAVLVLLAATAPAEGPPAVADLPRADFAPPGPRPEARPLLGRTHDLFRMFGEGQGTLEGAVPARGEKGDPLPWRVAAGRGDSILQKGWTSAGGSDLQGTSLLRLGPGQRWCSPQLAPAPGARLRFEAFALGGPAGRLLLATGGPPQLLAFEGLPHGPDGRLADVPLAGAGPVCFSAEGGEVGVAEPRVLAPERPEADPRPRWIVLTISDTLRADAWPPRGAADAAPRIAAFAAGARRYEDARTPGSHTNAATWPLLTGRDLMRIGPYLRLNPRWSRTVPLDPQRVFSHPNLFVGQYAEAAGYRSAFVGNNTWPGRMLHAFSRYTVQGSSSTGTLDGARALPSLLARYADERLLLVQWIAAAHPTSSVPRRLFDELGCGALSGLERDVCGYRARVRHNDEAVGALLDGIEYHGMGERSLVVLTADHGEAFADGWPIERFLDGAWNRMDRGHGQTNGPTETKVPLLARGPGIAPASWSGRVSTLDIVPTLLGAMGVAPAGRMDGQVLPLFAGAPRTDGAQRRFVTYGFCGHSDGVGARQLTWWDESSCPRRRVVGQTAERREAFDLRQAEALVPDPPPAVVEALRRSHAEWLTDRMPGETLMFDTAALPPGATLTLRTPNGRIVDHGPSGAAWGFETLGPVTLSPDERAITVALGGYRGLYSIATRPSRAVVEIGVPGGAVPTVFVGPHQLPLEVLGRPFDPAARAEYTVSAREPEPQAAEAPFLRVWWQPYEAADGRSRSAAMEEFNRVLREWGYIR